MNFFHIPRDSWVRAPTTFFADMTCKYKTSTYNRVDCKGVDCPSELAPTYEADYVIVTATAPAIQNMEFSPLLSQNKSVALRSTYYESSSKILLAFESPFWESNPEERKGGYVITDLPLQTVHFEGLRKRHICTIWRNLVLMILGLGS